MSTTEDDQPLPATAGDDDLAAVLVTAFSAALAAAASEDPNISIWISKESSQYGTYSNLKSRMEEELKRPREIAEQKKMNRNRA